MISIFLNNLDIQIVLPIAFSTIFYNVLFFQVSPNTSGMRVESSVALPKYQNAGSSIWHAMFIIRSAMYYADFVLFCSTLFDPFRNDNYHHHFYHVHFAMKLENIVIPLQVLQKLCKQLITYMNL